MNLLEIKPKYVEYMPEELENGILYISDKFQIAIHLCACGCCGQTVTPLGDDGWILSKIGEAVTLRPSIGNWSGESPYHAHYYITENKIQWL
jgi:hypothetical protein